MITTRRLGFTEAIRRGMSPSHFGSTRARARRSEFWWCALFCVMCMSVIDGAIYLLREHTEMSSSVLDNAGIILNIYFVVSFYSCMTRRIHDIGRTPTLLNLAVALGCMAIPLSVVDMHIGLIFPKELRICMQAVATVSFVATLVICTYDSEKGKNRYGYSDKYIDEEDNPHCFDKLYDEYKI